MSKREISYGKCFACGRAIAKSGITRHLKACPERKKAKEAEAASRGRKAWLFHIRAEGKYDPFFWMDIEIPAQASFDVLDHFLRAVWLECCGHLSQFIIDGVYYSAFPEEDLFLPDLNFSGFGFGSPRREESMEIPLGRILHPRKQFTYEYDFGSTTHLNLKVIGEGEGRVRSQDVVILARNYMPTVTCDECDRSAQWLYVFEYPFAAYCDEHAGALPEGGEGLLPVVNSPRAGECGYDGPYDESLQFMEAYPTP